MADTTVKLKADISNLKSQMQAAARQVKLANSEFKAAASGMDDWSKNADGLRAKLKQLDTVLQSQKTRLSLLEDEYKKTVELYGENSAAADRVKISINNMKAAINNTEKEIENYNEELKKAEKYGDGFEDSVDEMNASTAQASDGFTVLKGALASLVADGVRLAINGFKELGKQTLEAGMNFEQGMAQVAAVSGASAEDMELLTEKAKEMGETTKFSATESAKAMNYMAMAGWKTEDMLNGIEGIMNLAAASGSDLATTSDIVTDALTAMGYQADDAGRLADVMAAASSNANTNVELMGQTFQYAAPLVGAMGYSMEDTAKAIGLMANSGIKGQKAGTALRSILSRLSAPPKECADAMDILGLSITDSEGNMKSLDEVMHDLRASFANMGEAQQTAFAKSIAGQEAMSGLLAIVNAAPADYDELTKAIETSEGAAESMANTMNDTVEGQLTLLKSQIEGIQIQIYENLQPALREGLDKIKEALTAKDWSTVGSKLGNFANKAIDLFIKIINNAEGIIDIMKAVGTVLATTFVVGKVLSFASSIATMVTTFKALKAATDTATTSQLLLNAAQAATPIGLVVAGVAALTAGIIYLASKNKEAEVTTTQLTDAENEQVDQINELNQAYKDMKSTRDESVNAITAEYGHYEDLAKELDSLVDANGAVKEADQERVRFIIKDLNEALGTEMEMIDGVIQNYQDEKAAIESLMVTKKAEAVLRANEEAYTTAIQNQNEALQNYMDAQDLYDQKQSEFNKKQDEAAKLANMTTLEYARQEDLCNNLGLAEQKLANEQQKANEEAYNAKAALGEANVALHNAENAYTGYESTIANYEGLSAAIISGDQQKISEALSNQMYDFQTAETGTRETLENQVNAFKDNYEQMEKAVQNHAPGVTQAMADEAKEMYKKAKAELDKLPPEAEKAGTKAGKDTAKGMESTKNTNKKAGEDIKKSAQSGAKDNGEMKSAGQKEGKDHASGIESTKSENKKAGKGIAQEAKKGADTKDATTSSKTSGENFGQGFINGIKSKFTQAFNVAKQLAQKSTEGVKKGQKEGSPSKITFQSGVYFVQGYINGIVSQQANLQRTVKEMVGGVVSILQNSSVSDLSTAADDASNSYASAIQKKFDYSFDKMTYQNEQKLKEFDDEIDRLTQSASDYSTAMQNYSDQSVKALEADRDASVNYLATVRDNAVKELESQRDATVKALNKQIDKLGKLDSDSKKKKKKQLEDEIGATKEYTKNQVNAIKSQYNSQIDSIKKESAKKIEATKESVKKEIEASKQNYDKLIEAQKANKDAYQSASSEMLTQYQAAMNAYQTQAQALIDDTINGITNRYNERYDELINKQNTLISKLKGAGDLFNVSGAGVMTVNDLTEQTKQIREYTSKLQQIKNKVSSELFDEIASFDMKEGSAYIDRLLNMSVEDLDAYNQAYKEKMEAAQEAGENIYKNDIKKVQSDYQKELNEGFKNLPSQLEELGRQAMQGFIDGLTENTDYMSDEIKAYIKTMVDTFKSELQIHSPSKVMAAIGDYTGAGLVEGLKSTISDIKKTASTMAQAVATPLDNMSASADMLRASYGSYNSASRLGGATTVNNNYNLVQNNTSPKALTALETYTARRQQIAMIKALT
ncbi:MAG: phage tail tape measure protein [Mogibacterium sp.]|nr:phage tail tape measure protein [Mogibacterium sp.]